MHRLDNSRVYVERCIPSAETSIREAAAHFVGVQKRRHHHSRARTLHDVTL